MSIDLPIAPLLPQLVDALARCNRIVLEAPPGAGKTTQVPLALFDAPWLVGKVLMLEPRRIAARAAASYMARQRNEAVGETIGFRIRGESKVSPRTRIEVVTEAILTRMLQDDPALEGIGALLFDEFHERNLHSDLGLALALDAQANLREDLRIVLMSATLEGERLARFLDAPRLRAEGRSYPVAIRHLPLKPPEDWLAHARRAVRVACEETTGDVLVFLPGKREIEQLSRALAGIEASVLPLHGELDPAAQQAALAAPVNRERRVVLATNVAESSVTLPAVRAVVDLGLAREPRFDPASGMSRLETVMISKASADQRAGRAGRVAEGVCLRLWPESQRLEPGIRPELMQVELTPLALELAAWGAAPLRWLDPPPAGPLAEARERLRTLGAIDPTGRVTAHGRALSRLPTHPRLAHAILAAPAALRGLACDLAALIEARDPLRGEARRNDDVRQRLDAITRWRRDRRAPADADAGALAQIALAAAELRRRAGVARDPDTVDPQAAGEVLALAYPDRVARQDPGNPRRYTLANGRGARLFDDSKLYGAPWIVASELRYDERDAMIQRGAPVDEAHLRAVDAGRFVRETELLFNDSTCALEAAEVERYGELVLARRRVPVPKDQAAATLLVHGIQRLGLDALPWTDAQRQWRTRVECLREWLPDAGLPDFSEHGLLARLDEWLGPWLEGITRVAELDAGKLGDALSAQLDHAQRRLLDEQAPAAIDVPSGRNLRLEYTPGQAPVLAVKLQEMFGAADTPRIARGRVAITLHLLSPAQRPIQVTQDLRGFWERTYPEVRRELKGRYPRHPWPDDPWNAPATHRAKPRGT
jgi:ATP-dependent helicase HrpB